MPYLIIRRNILTNNHVINDSESLRANFDDPNRPRLKKIGK
jgi:S1-C subfamily serine protease